VLDPPNPFARNGYKLPLFLLPNCFKFAIIILKG
jgi:hypothetical protein